MQVAKGVLFAKGAKQLANGVVFAKGVG